MILGFSDAEIVVTKRGQGVREQGILCEYIGSRICPRINKLLDNGYEMELLSVAENRDILQLRKVYLILENFVWTKSECPAPSIIRGGNWLDRLYGWSTINASWLTNWISYIYPEEPKDGYSCIHGDPTLANLMLRDGKPILTDPMPRVGYRIEIPNRREVDLGKLLQSAIGWEYMLNCPNSISNGLDTFLDWLRPSEQPLALLWGAIHLARLANRAPGKGRSDIATWARNESHRLAEMIREC